MSIIDDIKKQFRSVIVWEDPQPGELFYKWTENGDEIKNASKLIVNPGQGCLFVYKGKVESVIETEGGYDLKTDNIPFLTSIRKWMQLMESEFKTGIYFFRNAQNVNVKYGTPSPILYNDPVYKFPVGLRAFGNYSFKIIKVEEFFRDIVASANGYNVQDIQKVINSRISQPFADFLAKSKHSYAEIDSNREEIARELFLKVSPILVDLGFEIKDFRIEGTSFDDDTQKRISKISNVQADALAAKLAGINYTELQQLEIMKDAANNQNGIAGIGAGLGAGMQMANAFAQNNNNSSVKKEDDLVSVLEKLKMMMDKGLITQDEYDKKKQEVLNRL